MASTSTSAGTSSTGQDVESVTHIQMAGLTVLMIKKKDQVIYKLPDNMSVTSLTQDQRERLLAEINLLHHQQTTAQAIAVTNAQTHQVQLAQAAAQAAAQAQAVAQGGVRSIAPVSPLAASQVPVTPIVPSASRLSALSTRLNQNAASADNQHKTTRRYNKTGKYSKKKLVQQQQSSERPTDLTGVRTGAGANGQVHTPDQLTQSHVFNNTPQAYQTTAGATMAGAPQAATAASVAGTLSAMTAASPSALGASSRPLAGSATATRITSAALGGSTTSKAKPILLQPSSLATLSPTQTPSGTPPLTPAQRQAQQSPSLALATPDQMKQLRLLQEIHLIQQQVEAQRLRADAFREHELAVRRLLANQRPVDEKTVQLAKEKLADAEGSLERFWNLLREKEATFREQFPVASQQLLLLQQQQQLARAAANTGATGQSTPPSRSPALTTTPYLGITPLQGSLTKRPPGAQAEDEKFKQEMRQYHESVSNGMSREVETAHNSMKKLDWRTPFTSLEDAIERLLPFHVYQYPTRDMDSHAKAFTDRSEEELNARSLGIHRRKHQLVEKYKELVKTHAAKRTRINPSLALEIVALRCDVVDEKESHRKVFEENESVQAEGRVLREELERRQANLVQQRKAEAVMIEQQQRLMLERQREEEEELEAAKQRLMAQQGQRLDETQKEQQVGLLHLQQASKVLTEEEEAQKKKDADRKEFERRHQLELERQMGIHQEQAERALSSLSSMSSLSALSSLVSSSSLSSHDSSGSGAQNINNNKKEEEEEARGA